MTDPTDGPNPAHPVVVVPFLDGSPERVAATLRSLLESVSGAVALPEGAETSDLAQASGPGRGRHVLIATAHVRVAPHGLDRAIGLLEADPRVATVSFLLGVDGTRPGADDVAPPRTAALRTHRITPSLAPLPVPDGVLTLVSRHVLEVCGDLISDPSLSAKARVVEFALRAQRHGFLTVLDPRPSIDGVGPPDTLDLRPAEWEQLDELHPILGVARNETSAPDSPAMLGRRAVITARRGLDVTIDGSSLRPEEMGTQVHTTSLIAALVGHDDVRRVTVVVTDAIPDYATATLQRAKVAVARVHGDDMAGVGRADVMHRPFQPETTIPFDAWREHASRIVVGLQDLILYQVGSYFPDGAAWSALRSAIRHSVAASDAVTVISDDVRRQVLAEALPVDPSRLFAVPLGTDHLRGDEATTRPAGLAGDTGGTFLLVLGTDYPHKHRDLAVAAWRLLQRKHLDLGLVVAGASMPSGIAGPRTPEPADGLVVLGDVSTAQRNWLLHHAAVVLYPTSAEGFGFIPFEAARFGTPTVNVSFGPLRELSGSLPVSASSWTAAAFATAVDALLTDPDVCRAQVAATSAAADRLTWSATADRLIEVYRSVLGRPAVGLAPLDAARRALTIAEAEIEAARRELDDVKSSGSYRLAMRISSAVRTVRRH